MPEKLVDFGRAEYQIIIREDVVLEACADCNAYKIIEDDEERARLPLWIGRQVSGGTLQLDKSLIVLPDQIADQSGNWCAAIVLRDERKRKGGPHILIPVCYLNNIVTLPIRWKAPEDTGRDSKVMNDLIRT